MPVTDTLQITEPPLVMCTSVPVKPLTGFVQCEDGKQPDDIHHQKRKTKINRAEKERYPRSVNVGNAIPLREKKQDEQGVNEVKMQYVIKKRHPAIHTQYPAEAVLRCFQHRQQQEGRSQHQAGIHQRWRVLGHI